MSFQSYAKAGLQKAINIMGTPFVWDSVTYYGVQSDNGATFDLEAGGFLADANFEMHCLKDDFETMPVIGDEITVEAKQYRIARIATSQQDPGFALACESVNK